jgi:hypothetical protein
LFVDEGEEDEEGGEDDEGGDEEMDEDFVGIKQRIEDKVRCS